MDLLWSRSQLQSLRETRASLQPYGKICFSERSCDMSGELLISDCEDLENLPASDLHVKRFKYEEVAQTRKAVVLPRADASLKLVDLLHTTQRKCPLGAALSTM